MANEKHYPGPDRRRGERRQNSDRREEVRYEPDKEPRRKLRERRKHSAWDDRHGF